MSDSDQWPRKHDITNFIKFQTLLTILDAILDSQSWKLKIWQQIRIQRPQKHNNVRFHQTFLLFFESWSALLALPFSICDGLYTALHSVTFSPISIPTGALGGRHGDAFPDGNFHRRVSPVPTDFHTWWS